MWNIDDQFKCLLLFLFHFIRTSIFMCACFCLCAWVCYSFLIFKNIRRACALLIFLICSVCYYFFNLQDREKHRPTSLIGFITLKVKPSSSSSTRDKCSISLSMINKSHHQNFSQRREKKYFKKNNCKHT